MPLIYTEFSSYVPPRTEYWLDISLVELTPARVVSIDSMLPPVASAASL